MKDHRLGYAPAAAHSAETEEEWNLGYEMDWSDDYPLGMPMRVEAEYQTRLNRIYATPHKDITNFEKVVGTLPDGSRINSRGQDIRTQQMDRIRDNITKNNLLLKGISCKPAPASINVDEDPTGKSVDLIDAYMRGYAMARREDTKAEQAQNAEKARAFNAARRERIVGREALGYVVDDIPAPAGGVIQKTPYTYSEAPCGLLGG